MKKKCVVICSFIFLFSFMTAANTFFLYTEEFCDDKAVALEESVREGIMEEIFEAGYIIFDDVSGKKYETAALMNQVLSYGARYLVVVHIQSQLSGKNSAEEKISSTADYALYDARGQKIVGEARMEKEENMAKARISRGQFWYNLGVNIGKEIEKIYIRYIK